MKRAFTLIEMVVVLAIVGLLACFVIALFGGRKPNAYRSMCQSNLKQIGLGFLQYSQDFNDKFPPAMNGEGQGWAEILQPYVKSTQLFQCPTNGDERSAGEFLTDYFYNLQLAHVQGPKLAFPATTIAGGDGQPARETWAAIAAIPPNWEPATKHLEGANYLFFDGHVKWFQPRRVQKQVSGENYSFEARRKK